MTNAQIISPYTDPERQERQADLEYALRHMNLDAEDLMALAWRWRSKAAFQALVDEAQVHQIQVLKLVYYSEDQAVDLQVGFNPESMETFFIHELADGLPDDHPSPQGTDLAAMVDALEEMVQDLKDPLRELYLQGRHVPRLKEGFRIADHAQVLADLLGQAFETRRQDLARSERRATVLQEAEEPSSARPRTPRRPRS